MSSIAANNISRLDAVCPYANAGTTLTQTLYIMERRAHSFISQAAANQTRAHEIIRETGIIESWEAIGAKVNLIGSLATGLLMDHLDIDFHIYTDRLIPADSSAAVAAIAAASDRFTNVTYTNLINTEEECIEWHAWYRDTDGRTWQIDMIHIRRGSAFDGFAERMAHRISEVLTPQTRETILRLKHATPDDMKIPGVEYYAAVLSAGITDYDDFLRWRTASDTSDLINWLP